MVFQLILGIMLAYSGFYNRSAYSSILFVEGIVLINLAVSKFFTKKSISRL